MKYRGINLHRAEDLLVSTNSKRSVALRFYKGIGWIDARPTGYDGLLHRIKLAWLVFTGHADVIQWPEQRGIESTKITYDFDRGPLIKGK